MSFVFENNEYKSLKSFNNQKIIHEENLIFSWIDIVPTGAFYADKLINFQVFKGSCGNLTCVKTIDSSFGGYTETLSYDTVEGTVYYVNVGGQNDSIDNIEGVFTIAIQREGD